MIRRYDLLYAIGAIVSSPFLAYSLLRTGKWRTDWRGRFGKTPPLPPDSRPTLLLHGVSVGEINATRELVARLAESGPDAPRVVISATTNTGFDRAVTLYGGSHPVVRFPFDFSWMVRGFLDRVRPRVVALMELEVWPNLAMECRRRGIPLVVINGRLSNSSFGNYRWARRWVRPMFRSLTAVAAQTREYADRFVALGTPPGRVTVTDTMKWDTVKLVERVDGASDLAADLGLDPRRPLVVAGSTGPGEEQLLIQTRPPGVQLLLVPRKPERFDEVARLAPGMVRRSQGRSVEHAEEADGTPEMGADLFLLDTMGELTKAYALADVAIVGRSFVPLGGSDPIEPVALGKPTLIGPHHENFSDVVAALEAEDGIRVTTQPMEEAIRLLDDPDRGRSMGERGRDVIRRRRGSTERNADLLLDLLLDREETPGLASGGESGGNPRERPEENPGESGDGEEAKTGDPFRPDAREEPERGDRRMTGAASFGGGGPVEEGRKGGRRRRGWRWAVAGLALYVAAGYLTTVLRVLDWEPSGAPTQALPAYEGPLLTGVFSVHTRRSHDAQGTRAQVAAAAGEAGLDFVVVGDHPQDDRRPDWALWDPEIMGGVLVEGGLELRAPDAGKVLAIGVDTTYKQWQGNLRSFVSFLAREGATSFVVHGRGPRGSERWVHGSAFGIQGWEVVDVSESFRHRVRSIWGPYHLLLTLLGYPVGLGDEALLHGMREGFDTPAVAAYDSLRMESQLTATAGLNVHPKLAVGPLLFPSYEPFFKTVQGHVVAAEAIGTDPAWAQRLVTDGIRRGEVFLSMGHGEAASRFRLAGVQNGAVLARMGMDAIPVRGMVLRGGFEGDPGRKVVYRILRNGRHLRWQLGPDLEWAPPRPGFYRVEVYTYSWRVGDLFLRLRPWIFANPIALRGPGDGVF